MLRPLQWVGLALVILGLARAAILVAHEPLAGFANQADMHRTGACLGLYPDLPGEARLQASPNAPLPRYKFEKSRADCYPSTEVGLVIATAMAASVVATDQAGFRLRWVGLAKLGLLGLTALLLAWGLRGHPLASLLHGAVVLLVLADPAVTLWFNTLYTEFTVAWGVYAAIGALCALALHDESPVTLWTLLAFALVGLAFSKEQYAWLPAALALAALPWLWNASRSAAVSMALIALAAGAASALVLPRPASIAMVNRMNTYLGLVVPASPNPAGAMDTLGLPARCAPLVGASWYLPRGENPRELCPEVFRLSSLAFVKLAEREPETLGRSVARVLPASQTLMPPYLGTLAGDRQVSASELPGFGLSPLDAVATRLPLPAFLALSLAMVLAAPLAFVAAIFRARPASGRPAVALLFAMLLGGTALHAMVSSAFGDGLSESARHYWAGHLATFVGLIALGVGLPHLLSRWRASPRACLLEIALGITLVAMAAAAIVASVAWARTQPLALGVIDKPEGRHVPAAGVKVRGWALDPFGVRAVQVRLDSKLLETRFGEPSPPRLQAFFPGYPDAARGGFEVELPFEVLAEAAKSGKEVSLRVQVVGREGAVTEIDARRLQVVP